MICSFKETAGVPLVEGAGVPLVEGTGDLPDIPSIDWFRISWSSVTWCRKRRGGEEMVVRRV